MRVILDCETNAIINPSKIWCIVCKDIDTNEVTSFVGDQVQKKFPKFAKCITKAIGHNIIAYDRPVLHRLVGRNVIPDHLFLDTLILSQLLHYQMPGGHSLEAWGERLNFPKIGLDLNFNEYSTGILDRCINDVSLNHRVYDLLLSKLQRPEFKDAIDVEHRIGIICSQLHDSGFKFDLPRAKELHTELSSKVEKLNVELQKAFPPKIKETVLKTKTRIEEIPFNPSSPSQIVDRLSSLWEPTDPTDSGKSWKVNEVNLATLKEDAPPAARKLVEYILLNSRVRTLNKWFECYNPFTERIHGEFRGLGTWTHRMSHRSPNMGNISAEKSIKYKTEYLKDLATRLGGKMRSLWIADMDSWLVGTDAEGIQLRIFAHYINDPEFTKSVISGKKEDGTDPHSLNSKILSEIIQRGVSRDSSKTFIYAYLLGAGGAKVAEILGIPGKQGNTVRQRYAEALPGLQRLKQEVIPRDAKRGYFQGFDGRLVACDSEHLMLAGFLQNGESCVVKHATVKSVEDIKKRRIPAKLINVVHDEIIFEVSGPKDLAFEVKKIVEQNIKLIGERFNLRCPMAGDGKVGKTWLETH